jgi:hypothetical protein
MLRSIIGNLYFLVFLNGFILASLFYFKMEANYENELFAAIKNSIDKKLTHKDNKDSVVVKIMNTCSSLLGNRSEVFNGAEDIGGLKADFLHPATIDLMTAKGACGSYSLVLARVLQNYHYPVRIVQMKSQGRYAAHNIIEVNVNTQWVVLDPLFDTYFVKPGGVGLASFDDVRNNWDFYKKQLPVDYNEEYVYADARYTNWNKIPFVFPAIKKILDLILGKKRVDTISLRVHFLRMYDLYYYITFILYVPLLVLTVRKLLRKKFLQTAANAPMDLSGSQANSAIG